VIIKHCLGHFVVETSQDTVSRNRFDYNKTDIPALKTELGKVNWHELMSKLLAENSWNVFREILEDQVYRLSFKRQKPIWMTNRALKAVKRRHQAYGKYRDPKHPAYVKAVRTAKRLLKEARQKSEFKLAQNISEVS